MIDYNDNVKYIREFLEESRRKTEEYMREVLSYFPGISAEREMIIRLLVDDGFTLEDLLDKDSSLVGETLEGTKLYLDYTGGCWKDAYKCYMH